MEEEKNVNEELGNVKQGEDVQISDDVVAVIAGVAVSEVKGVSGKSTGIASGISEVFGGKKNLAKGIKVDVTDKEVKVDVNVIIEYGVRIPDVAFEIQNRVKRAVETMTGLQVSAVNVHVQGINTKPESETEETVENKFIENKDGKEENVASEGEE